MKKLFALLAVCGFVGFQGCGAEVETTGGPAIPAAESGPETPEMTPAETEEGTTEEAASEEGTSEEGATEEGASEEGTTEEAAPEEGAE